MGVYESIEDFIAFNTRLTGHAPLASEIELARRLLPLDAEKAFEEHWRDDIEQCWREQFWPTFKDMARDIFEAGYTRAIVDQIASEPYWRAATDSEG